MPGQTSTERLLILIKAAPHPSTRHGETVCCAGVTEAGEWRRLFPVRFRNLADDQQFSRWDWVSYEWRLPRDDVRRESRRLQEPSLKIDGKMGEGKRAAFLDRVIVPGLTTAMARGDSLALVRPNPGSFRFSYKPRTAQMMETERSRSAAFLAQLSFLDKRLDPLRPCPYEFTATFEAEERTHNFKLGDWETEAMFWNLSRRLGEVTALKRMVSVFNDEYPTKGMALALGTKFRFPKTWLLLGILRLDQEKQLSLL